MAADRSIFRVDMDFDGDTDMLDDFLFMEMMKASEEELLEDEDEDDDEDWW